MHLLRSQNVKLEKQVNQVNLHYQQMQSQCVQQADRYEELITNLTARQSQQSKKMDEIQLALFKKIQFQDKQLENYEEVIKDQSKKFSKQ